MVAIAGDQRHHVITLVHAQLKRFEGHQHVNALLALAAHQVLHGQVVRLHAVVHQHIVKYAVVVQLVGLFIRILGTEPAAEKVGIDDVAQTGRGSFPLGDHVLDEFMHASNVQPAAARMHIIVIIAYVRKIAAIIENAHFEGGIPGMI